MTVFAEFTHPRNGALYIDPRDIMGFRTNLKPDEIATTGKPLVVIMRSGANEEIVGLSMEQIIQLRELMTPLEKSSPVTRFIPSERLMDALSKASPNAQQRPTLHLNNR